MPVSTTRAGLPSRLFTPKTTSQPRTPDSYGVFVLRKAKVGNRIGQVVHLRPHTRGNIGSIATQQSSRRSKARPAVAHPAASGGAFGRRSPANLPSKFRGQRTWA